MALVVLVVLVVVVAGREPLAPHLVAAVSIMVRSLIMAEVVVRRRVQ